MASDRRRPAGTAVDRAQTSAARLAAAAGSGHVSELVQTFAFHGEALAATWLEDGWNRQRAADLVSTLAAATELAEQTTGTVLYVATLRARSLLTMAPAAAIETVFGIFTSLSSSEHASLWSAPTQDRLLLVHGTHGGATRTARLAAERAVATGRPVTGQRALVHAVPAGPRAVALAYRCSPGDATCLTFALEAAATLGFLFVADDHEDRGFDEGWADGDAAERLLVRLGFDLHDGPMQDIAALALDVRLFRSQLATVLEANEHRETALGRVDDLEARLVELDHGLRELAGSLQSPSLKEITLTDALEREAASFRHGGDIELIVRTSGDVDDLTPSQKITLLRVIQGALSNVRRHSGARSVTIVVSGTRTELAVVVSDDGRGFDVEKRLPDAARTGRLGLIGMRERVRLLGGRFEVVSPDDGSTEVRATIPRWRPLA